jgi:glycosyltransferase involved in cell wall biosynthesis
MTIDGGKNWISIKGAPCGDDYHRIWINPLHPDIMIFAADQGAVITVNGGKTWSSWYNQPTAQLYHVSTDNQFPYHVYGGQQESGAIGVSSRGNGGQISFRDWYGVGADEYAYVAPDPLNPDIIYGGRVLKFNKKTGQTQYVGPEPLKSGQFRVLRTMPLLFHPANPKMLLFATNVLWKTMDGGYHWDKISPDLSREQPDVPQNIGSFKTPELNKMPRRGVIYSVGPSPLDSNIIWVGTDDGLVHLTQNGGKTWLNITPPSLRSWDKIACQRVDKYLAISKDVQARTKKYYDRDSEVIYPPVNFLKSENQNQKSENDYFLVVSRLVYYKRVDIVIKAFNKSLKNITFYKRSKPNGA